MSNPKDSKEALQELLRFIADHPELADQIQIKIKPASVATLPKTDPPLSLRAVAGCLLGKAPNPCSERTVNEWQTEHETLCCASL